MASYRQSGEVGEREHEAEKSISPLQILRQVERDLKKKSDASKKHRELQKKLAEWLVSTGCVKSVRAEYVPYGSRKYDLYVEWDDGRTEAIEVMRRAAFGDIPYGRRRHEGLLDYALRLKGYKGSGDAESKLFAYSIGGADMNSLCVPIETYGHVMKHVEKSGLRLSKVYTFEEGKDGFELAAVLE